MGRIVILLVIFLFIILSTLSHGSQSGRPFAGTGLLQIPPPLSDEPGGIDPVVVYETPGMRRVAELRAGELPRFPGLTGISPDCLLVSVVGKKGKWLKIPYDDADREGWILPRRYWNYIPWGDFLAGRTGFLLPKLPGRDYVLRKEPSELSSPLETLPPARDFRISFLDGDWAFATMGDGVRGWVRWRGNDGRILISLRENLP